ncbi:signal peptidase I [Streptacidiphilus jiangxiensis]|uniref:Signal peptidase I n=1 Tax=Streptacidiphilus jiangxiensis TaxID=235985 RepID=A0A1H7XXF6_STRJI|nr:signal peptidase I [Streptacidiphilus jiangxiensis]SEM37649.1 signal peptidase I [Streptacidiphilus jiangxiensis]
MDTQQLPEDRDSAPSPVQDEGTDAPSRSFGVSRRVKELAALVAVCVLALVLLNRFVAQPFTIPSSSMENTLAVGDRVLVNKLSYDFGGSPKRGDVVVFDGRGSFIDTVTQDTTDGSGNDFVKRVIGIGGDTVKCCDARGRITVDGVELDESSYLHPGAAPSSFPFVVQVPAGELFVLGDNRAVSADSRAHLGDPGGGFVPVSKVVGRAEWVIMPVGHWRSLGRPSVFAGLDRAIAAGGASRGHQG